MIAILRKCALALFGDYGIYFIYRFERGAAAPRPPTQRGTFDLQRLDENDARASADPLVQSQIEYFGPGASAFACLDGSRVVGLCFYWAGERYKKRNFWPLADDEAKLVQIVTLPEMRGRGIAGDLIASSAQAMFAAGFRQLYARIWHSNKPSWRAFARAGWKRAAFVVEVQPLRRSRTVRVRLGRRPLGDRR